jgi:ABC-type nitrate/sulfonate/bicarbonate transport system substrate-binding protein
MKIKFFSFLAPMVVSQVSMAKPLEKINVCFQEYREEMVTAALMNGEANKIFEKAGFQINWIKNDEISKREAGATFHNSNFNTNSKDYYFNGSISEVALLKSAANKKCDFISTTFEAVVASKMNLAQLVPVATYRYGQDYDTHLVVRKDSGINSVKDLKGKKIRINQIGSIIPFENMLKQAGLKPSDVTYERMALADIPKALDEKKIDAVLSYNPTIPLLLGSDRVKILESNIFSRFYGHFVPHSLLVTTKEFQAQKKDVFEKFMKAFSQASVELSKKPENVVYSVPHVSQLYKAADIEKSLSFISVAKPLIVTEMGKEAFVEQSNFAKYASVLQERGFIKDPVDISTWK